MKNSSQHLSSPRKWGVYPYILPTAKHVFLALLIHVFILFSFGPQKAAAEEISSPQRIISLSPSITEVLFALGAGHRVVGVTDFCQYPERTKLLPKVGGLLNPHAEAIISLQPDLLIHHYDNNKIKKFADHLSVQSLSVSFDNLDSIYQSIKKVGIAIKELKAALLIIENIKEEIRSYRSKIKNLKPKSVLLILGDSEDPLRDLYGVGKGTFLDELLTLAGGQNILTSSPALYPKVSREFIISASPEIIIIAGPKARLSKEELKEKKNQWNRLATVQAVKDGNIHYIGADYILIPGPRLTKIVEKFAKTIHSETLSGNDSHGK